MVSRTTLYITGNFPLDFLCALPFLSVAQALDEHSLEAGLVRMLRVLFVFLPMVRSLRNTFSPLFSWKREIGLIRVSYLIIGIVSFCYWAGCCWWLIGVHQ